MTVNDIARRADPGSRAGTALRPLRRSRVALLTTLRRDGRPVATPVGIRVLDDRALFTTRSRTWKVRRIASDPRVTLAPCTKRGRVLGETVACVARRVEGTGAPSFEGRFWTLVYRVFYRDVPVTYEVIPLPD